MRFYFANFTEEIFAILNEGKRPEKEKKRETV
jgi:hypothetical protein